MLHANPYMDNDLDDFVVDDDENVDYSKAIRLVETGALLDHQ